MGLRIWLRSCPEPDPIEPDLYWQQVVAGVLQEAPDGIGLRNGGNGDTDRHGATDSDAVF